MNQTGSSQGKNKGAFRAYYALLRALPQRCWRYFLIGIVATILLSSTDALLTFLVKPVINIGFEGHFRHSQLSALPYGLAALLSFRLIMGFCSSYFINRMSRSVVRGFRRRIFNKILHLPLHYFARESKGSVLSKMLYHVDQIAQSTSDTMIIVFRESTLFVGMLFLMLRESWQMCLMLLLIAPLAVGLTRWVSRRIRALSHDVQGSVSDVARISEEGVNASEVIRLFGTQDQEKKRFNEATQTNFQKDMRIVLLSSLNSAFLQFLLMLPLVLVVALVSSGHLFLSAGGFALMITALVQLPRPVKRLSNVNPVIQRGIAASEALFAFFDEPEESKQGLNLPEKRQASLSLQSVGFAYPGCAASPVLKGINLTIEAGETVALVGASGAGKSTLTSLLPRFYDCTEGRILLDGVDTQTMSLASLRRCFAYVSQKTVLLHGSLRANLCYGSPHATEAQIQDAAEQASILDFILSCPQGFDTPVGDNGILLSGGQRQRIAIARALLRDVPLFIFDEATASLDTASERHIQHALKKLQGKRTVIVVAHRLSTIEHADRIAVMQAGRIVETGTHSVLLAQGGAYAALHDHAASTVSGA
jgi:ATP-binding cassette, subfamily B, bacterial MsbA